MLSLTVQSVLAPNDTRYYQPVTQSNGSPFRHKLATTITIRDTKTGPYTSVVINEQRIDKLLLYWLKQVRRSNTIRLCNFTLKTYNKLIQQSCQFLCINHIHYTTHSMRHGGASYDLQRFGLQSLAHMNSVHLYTIGAARVAESAPLTSTVLRDFNDYQFIHDQVIINFIRCRSGAPVPGA